MIPWSPPPELIDPAILAEADSGTLLLLPDKIGDEGQALYRDDNAGLVKTVRAQGAKLDFAWPRDQRVYLSEFGAGEVIANVMLGVIGNFTTDTIKYMVYAIRIRVAAALGRGVSDDLDADNAITVKIARFESSSERRLIEGLECTGPANEVVKLIESLADTSERRQVGDGSNGQRR
jgi:hypothetical protein